MEFVVDFIGYRVSFKFERDISWVILVNINVSLLCFDGLYIFINYCVMVELLIVLVSMWLEDCYDFVIEDDGEMNWFIFVVLLKIYFFLILF